MNVFICASRLVWSKMSINEPQMSINFYFKIPTNNFMRKPNPERGYLWIFKKNNLWTFMAHWWTFMTKKNKDIFVEKNKRHFCRNITSCASQTPKGGIYGHSKKIIHEHLWLIDGHLWRKKQRRLWRKTNIYDEKNKRHLCRKKTRTQTKMAICSYNK